MQIIREEKGTLLLGRTPLLGKETRIKMDGEIKFLGLLLIFRWRLGVLGGIRSLINI